MAIRALILGRWTRIRFAHYFASIGTKVIFFGVPKFDPDFREDLLVMLGDGVVFGPQVSIRGRGLLKIGNGSSVNSGVIFGMTDSITIGESVLIADNVSFRTADHEFADRNTPIVTQGERSLPIVVNDDVWIGANVVILRGVTVGRGSVIAANAVVREDIPDFAIVGGVPGRIIGWRGKDSGA